MSSDTKHPKLLQVYNISTAANNDVIRQLFQYFGRIEEFQVYPILVTANTKQKVAYIRYDREKSVLVAQHMTNTVFFDRALVCVPATSNNIPDEETALQNSAALGKRALPSHVVNKIEENEEGQKMLYTIDPTLTNLGLPSYPPLGADLDPEKIEETRRTVYVGGLKKDVDANDIIKFFNTIGEVMYLRMANVTEHHDCAYCYIEFTSQTSVPQALQNDGVEFQGQPIRIQHSRVPIVKPQQKTNDQAMEEIEEAMRRRDKGESDRRGSRTPKDVKKERRSRSRSPEKKKRRENEDEKRSRDKDTSSGTREKKGDARADTGSGKSLVSSDLNRGASLDAVETTLRERLLAKQMEKKRRGSDEMDISD
ncbi:hypothetical protein FO519_008407 [Halicephalobus sp. NKZ332]|nr:hypothetical protein FO519_008407 [Halicephalobus sp. NKZ332]